MKLTQLPSCLALLAAIVGFTPAAVAKNDKPIPVDRSEALQVVIHDNVMMRTRDAWTRPNMETERFLVMKDALRNAAEDNNYPGEVKVERFAGGLKDYHQRLTLYVYRWELGLESFGRSMTVEFAMDATLTVGDEEWDMGSFRARSSHYASGGPTSEDFGPAAERAIEQMIEMYQAAIADAATSDK